MRTGILLKADVHLDPLLDLHLVGGDVEDGSDAGRQPIVVMGTSKPEAVAGKRTATPESFILSDTSTSPLPGFVRVWFTEPVIKVRRSASLESFMDQNESLISYQLLHT